MGNLQVTARFQIHNGRLDEFKELAEECLSRVKAKEKDTFNMTGTLTMNRPNVFSGKLTLTPML